jgi:histidinol-phosphate aminotransferase
VTVPDPLRHHGDAELAPGLIDLAVNVRHGPPDWLRTVLAHALTTLSHYPDPRPATAAVADRHGRECAEVLLTSGAAEAFVLIARALRPAHAVVVHPQFTEPEAALRAAGHRVDRLVLTPDTGFALDPARVAATADLVVIGNPTNPTSVLHTAAALRAVARAGRVLVVDEAFMDAVPDERESLAAARDVPGLLVVRSLTKTWGLAGLRAGYVLGGAPLVAELRRAQPLWPVSGPALAAAAACSSPGAVRESRQLAVRVAADRGHLLTLLDAIGGVRTYGVPMAPFVLVRTPGRHDVHGRLRERGIAVRRGDTFPGLDGSWLRVAVRSGATGGLFAAALAEIVSATGAVAAGRG